jgi:hypothetical protein
MPGNKNFGLFLLKRLAVELSAYRASFEPSAAP